MKTLHGICSLFVLTAGVLAQAPTAVPAPAGTNVVINGDFAKSFPIDNLWDGVDDKGFLCGWRRSTYAVTESGKVGGLEVALSVDFVDINGDQLLDLITADAAGFLRAYINHGTKTEPKFDYAEIIPLFPPQIAKDNAFDGGYWTSPHSIPKINMVDWSRRGAPDMIIGNYTGDILLIPNTGSAQAPAFAQPSNYSKVLVPTSAKRPWGNLFAPYAIDWNKDGKMDLLVGEGSYSANAVHLLLNSSNGSAPTFTEDKRYYLCYGDGREQLVPTVADWNGDGFPDVLVGDRLGTIGVYLNNGQWKPGTELPLATNVMFGTVDKLNTAVAPNAADFNGDGLFDLVIGKATGRLGIAINKGTKAEPKFDAPMELQGKDLMTEKINLPGPQNVDWRAAGVWTMDVGNNRGNLYAYGSVHPTEASPGGGKVLKFGFFPSPNKVFKLTPLSVDGKDRSDYFHYWAEEWEPIPANWAGYSRQADTVVLRQTLSTPLKVGGNYEVTFKAKGVGFENGICTVAYLGAAENVATKFKRGERGAVKAEKDDTHEIVEVTENFTAGGAWKNVSKSFTVAFKDKNLKKLDATTLGIIEFKFNIPQYSATCEICDVQLVAKPGK
jgi:hypothetical protein